jgi:hypothetical protein
VRAERFVEGVLIAGSAVFAVGGAWCFADPASFYDHVALFQPYNRHFLHDLGAFQLGLGAALALGLTAWDGRRVALWAAAVASVLHAVSHVMDSDLGGRETDSVALSLVAVLFVAAALLAGRTTGEMRHQRRARPPRSPSRLSQSCSSGFETEPAP